MLLNLRAILEAAGSGMDKLVKTTVFLTDLDDFQGMNEVYARHVGDQPPARSTFEVAKLPPGAARRDRSNRDSNKWTRRSRTSCEGCTSTRTSSVAPCATSCSGASRRTRTSSCPGWTSTACTLRSSRTGRSRSSRSPGVAWARVSTHGTSSFALLAPAGIEFAPPRVERSTGPGRHDFEIVADPELSIED